VPLICETRFDAEGKVARLLHNRLGKGARAGFGSLLDHKGLPYTPYGAVSPSEGLKIDLPVVFVDYSEHSALGKIEGLQ
jgi:hypothetical protein